MIFFKPTVLGDGIVRFEAIENEAASAECKLIVNGSRAEITSISCNGDRSLVEGIIKSAFNYAALKNCYMGYCKCDEFAHILDGMNFSKADGVYFNDIPSILTGNCCKSY